MTLSAVLPLIWGLAPSAEAAAPARYGEPTYLHFENGLQVVLQPSESGQTVSVFAQVDAGWIADPAGAKGAAHLTEHLVLRRPVGTGTVWTDRKQRGCALAATTHPDATRYQWTCPSAEQEAVTADLLQLLTAPLEGVDEAVVAVEASIIDQEEHERETLGAAVSRTLFANLLAEDHPVHAHLGVPDFDAPALGLSAAQDFVAARYTPDRFTVGVAGAFDADALRAVLVERFGAPVDLPPEARSRPDAPPPTRSARTGLATTLDFPVVEPRVVVGWNLPPGVGGSAALDLAAGHLAGALQKRLEEDGDGEETVLGVGCSVNDHPEAAALLCSVVLPPGSELAAGQKRVSTALLDLWEKDARKALRAQLERAAQEAPRTVLSLLSAPAARARNQVYAVDAGRLPRTVEESIKVARGWSPAGFEKLAARVFRPETAAWVHVRPDFQARERAVADLPAALPAAAAASTPAAVPAAQPVEVAWGALDNGVTVVAVRQAESPQVMATVRVPGGEAAEPYGLARVAGWLTSAVPPVPYAGVGHGEISGQTHTEVYAFGPSRALGSVLRTASDLARLRVPALPDRDPDPEDVDEEASTPRQDLERVLARSAARMRADAVQPGVQLDAALDAAVMPGHAPTQGLSAEALEAVAGIQASALRTWLARTWQPGQALVLVSGPDEPDQMLRKAEKVFKSWESVLSVPEAPYAWTRPAAPAEAVTAVAHAPAATSAATDWRCRLPDGVAPEVASVVDHLVEGALWDALRARRGLVYTPSVGVVSWPDGSTMLRAGWQTAPERAGTALAVAGETLAGLAEVSDEAVAGAAASLSRGLAHPLSSLAGREALVAEAFDTSGVVGDVSGWHQSRLAQVSADAVRGALQACVEAPSWGVLGPQERTLPGLQSALGRKTAANILVLEGGE